MGNGFGDSPGPVARDFGNIRSQTEAQSPAVWEGDHVGRASGDDLIRVKLAVLRPEEVNLLEALSPETVKKHLDEGFVVVTLQRVPAQ